MEPILRAEEELEHYRRQGPLIPSRAYDLVLAVTGNKELALTTQVQIVLNNMPDPK